MIYFYVQNLVMLDTSLFRMCDLTLILSNLDKIWFKSLLDILWFKDAESVHQGEKPVYKAELKQIMIACLMVSLHSMRFFSEGISLFTINCPL